ncbi:pentatricopeptide repeat-containing protein At3g20730-like [Andrographis paniculata]|uniref:pentatricopeptide repeat-containing protein At3g20730-like n=1 Tax=Andrographis paniculata TaxID=175694 RepID=UPI0021E87FA2|nr:pentatricopeptide repeat-containing protein At3g20730-like [Andrographis paniculata]
MNSVIIDSLRHSGNLGALYSRILRQCSDTKWRSSVRAVHGRIITDGLQIDTCLRTSLIIRYSKLREMENAQKLFDKMSERDVVTWTALISGYSRIGDYDKASKIFSAMRCHGVKANQYTYGIALYVCTQLQCLQWGKQIHGFVWKTRFVNNVYVQSALVDLYSKCGTTMDDARQVFDSMETRDLVSWNSMIGGFAEQGLSAAAASIFRRMLIDGILPDTFTFGSLLKSAVRKNGIGIAEVRIVHGLIIHFGFGSNRFLTASLVDAYVKNRSTSCANRVYDGAPEKDVVACTALIKATNYATALRYFKEIQNSAAIDGMLLCSMLDKCAKTASLSLGKSLHSHAVKSQNRREDVAIGNALINMYSKSGAIECARRAFDEMDKKNVVSWTSLIDSYGKHGRAIEAIALYAKMDDEGLKPNDVTFVSLLFACSHTGLTAEGFECFRDMIEKHKISPRIEHYSCLVDLVARRGCLEEAYDLMRRVLSDVDAQMLGAMLGACRSRGNTNFGWIGAERIAAG